jgi:hypothetical protein
MERTFFFRNVLIALPSSCSYFFLSIHREDAKSAKVVFILGVLCPFAVSFSYHIFSFSFCLLRGRAVLACA